MMTTPSLKGGSTTKKIKIKKNQERKDKEMGIREGET